MPTITDLQARALEVCDFLERLPRTYAAPVVVKIGREVYAGATYSQVRDTPSGSPAYASGERAYSQQAMYLLGRLPYAYRRTRRTCFRIPGARFPWYVAGWNEGTSPRAHTPLGPYFQLMLDKHGVCTDDNGNPYREQRLDLIG